MFSHITVGTNNLENAKSFYDKVLGTIGLKQTEDYGNAFAYGTGEPNRASFIITVPYDEQPATYGNGTHVSFLAPSRASVDEFHSIALAEGGTDEGKPGLRPDYGSNYYAAYVRDLDGNKLQAVCYSEE